MNPAYSRPFPLHALYIGLRLAFEEVRTNLQAPDGLIAGAFWVNISISCSGDIDVLLPTGQRCPCVVYVGTIADSGERKTATDNVVLAPVYARDAKQAIEHKAAMTKYRAKHRVWSSIEASLHRKLLKASNKGGDIEHLQRNIEEHAAKEPSKPERGRIVYESITERALMEAIQGESRCVAILSDEGSLVLNSGTSNKMVTVNKIWGAPTLLTYDRMDDSIEAHDPRLTLSFMIQQKMFDEFLKKRGEVARESGFFARLLICRPASTQGFRLMSLDEPVWHHLTKFHRRTHELLEATASRRATGDTSRKLLSFSPDAKQLWVNVQNYIEPKLQAGGELESVRDFASKSLEIVGRLAACLHHFEGLAGDVISHETLQRAINIVEYYFDEFRDLFGKPSEVPQEQKDVQMLRAYLHQRYWKYGINWVARNEVRKCGPIRHQGRFEAALRHLCWETSVVMYYDGTAKRKGKAWINLIDAMFSQLHPQ